MRAFAILVLIAGAACHAGAEIEELHRLDLLPRFRQSAAVSSISSHDRTGGNDDGFSGKYSYVGKEGDGLVIADLQGPGVIYRIWTPTPTGDITEFYFDGEETPRIRLPFRDLFTGEQAPFLAPVVGFGGGGFYSYVPLPYKKSCKIIVRAEKVRFYQINYATYPESAGIETYPGPGSGEFMASLEKARRLFGLAGSDISEHLAPPGTKLRKFRSAVKLAPGKPVTIFRTEQAGRIAGIRMRPASAFAGKDRGILLKIYWDGEAKPAVLSPAGDFFGYAWGKPAMRSLLLGTNGNTNYVYLPMPFDSSARIELLAEGVSAPAVEIETEVVFAELPRSKDEGKFHAIWRRENPTTIGKPFTFLEASGRGHLAGAILQAQGLESGRTPFFEGDDQTTLDGKLVVHGTGSEDFFNGGWYNVPGRWNGRVSLPLSGALDYNNPLARTGGYRFFITDVYPFRRSILQTIEHAPTGNKLPADYAAVTFFYADEGVRYDATLPPVEARRVRDLDRIVFQPGWNVPIRSFSLRNAALGKKTEKLNGRSVRYLAMRAKGEDTFGPHHVSFACDLPSAGRYKVSIEALQGPSAAIVQLFRHERAIGAPADLFSSERKQSGLITLGEFDFEQGLNEVFFKLTGKNPQSTGLDFDLVRVVFETRSDCPGFVCGLCPPGPPGRGA